ncbi:MAG: ester cyclase [Dehalococcoidia bacterium]
MPDTTEENKDLVRRLYDVLHARGDAEAARALLAPDYVDHDIPGLGSGGREELIAAVLAVRGAFPDVQPELYELLAEEDLVAVRVEASATHTGAPFNGIPAAGARMRWKEIHIFRCRDSQIVEHRGVFDMLGILQQLGALPTP